MTRAHDDERLADVYQAGNEMPERSLEAWVRFIGSLANGPVTSVLDVGAGTGMFCAAMARWLPVSTAVGVEPSLAMVRCAVPGVHYVAGTAEQLPVASRAFDLALLSRVVHHLPDRRAAAAELVRVLRPGGTVVVRTTFRERLDALVYDYWPRLREIDSRRFPSRDEVVADLTAAGLSLTRETSFAQPVAADLREYRARMATAPLSKFAHLSPAEFADGLARMDRAGSRQPVEERYDVVAFTRRGMEHASART
ncbi:class I SAM-dependent methyltransferase [Amycolatopsis suaedae]|uniref:class I SAM-dependent methyltransferase n=1 Tax=Amycolatopsis suaedae TaxID=2510978 RepID=UPI0013EF3B22|nr:class I SAM-dependent methyltransferase [Amycolatopsis suaedae]